MTISDTILAIALQKNVLFATTVAENIGYAGDYKREQIEGGCTHRVCR